MTAEQLTAQYIPLPPEAKRQIDDFVAFIGQRYAPAAPTRVRGVPGKELLRFAGTISPDDLALMKRATEEDCERIDSNE